MSRMSPRTGASAKTIRFAITGALTVGLLTGCAASSHLARAGDHAARASAKANHAVEAAEQQVVAAPNDAAARLALGQAYLDAGRFQSAATTFSDAVTLGDASGSTRLRLALAQIGAGDTRSAIAVLDAARDSIAPVDRGLALALAGEPGRGVAVLLDALRDGENSPKLRQNLAFAYALDGHWREARIAMAQDVPANQMDDRISDWAMMSRPGDVQRRVASLLSVPAGVQDAGQPQQLALVQSPAGEQRAAAEPAAPVAQTAAVELPPVDQAPAAVAPVSAPVVAESAPAPAPASTSFAAAFAAPQAKYVANPVVQPVPARTLRVAGYSAWPAAHAAAPRVAARTVAFRGGISRGDSHAVQLGSFSSEASARRAVKTYTAHNSQLRGLRMIVTPAVVNGKNYWRVAVAGLDGNGAARLCSGKACASTLSMTAW